MVKHPVTIITVAAGSGTRFGATLPKQFCLLEGRPVLLHTMEALLHFVPHARMVLALSSSGVEIWSQIQEKFRFTHPVTVVLGGETRWHTVRNALSAIPSFAPDEVVLVHDGARPLVDPGTVLRVLEKAREKGAAVPVVPVTDSLRRVDTPESNSPVDRSLFRAVQTPQGFRASLIARAYSQPFSPVFTDDASVAQAAGYDISLVGGNPENIKITHAYDMATACAILNARAIGNI